MTLDIDGTQIYDNSTGETVGELENLSREQLKELLEGRENEST
jgi:hypothetical protein